MGKLAAYPRRNSLALALRELGKLERIFFTLQWLQDPELRRRSHVGLNENQRHRASGLNLLVAAIILWNTTYLQRAVDRLRDQGQHPAPGDLAHVGYPLHSGDHNRLWFAFRLFGGRVNNLIVRRRVDHHRLLGEAEKELTAAC